MGYSGDSESQVVMDTYREVYDVDNMHHIDHYNDNNNNNNDNDDNDKLDNDSKFSGSGNNSNNGTYLPDSPKRTVSLDEFTIETDIDVASLSSVQRVEFEGEIIMLENRNIFQNNKIKLQMVAAMISLFLIGLTDQVIGSLMEYILNEYNIDRVQISYLFVAQFCGYIPASMFNNYFMGKFGLHIMYSSSCFFVLIPSFLFFIKAPYFLLPICSICIGWSFGTIDCVLNSFVGSLDYSNELLGIMHSMYGFGCLVTPVLSISLIQRGMFWNQYYLLLLGTAFVNLIMAYAFFGNETAAKYRYLASSSHSNLNSDDNNNDNDDFDSNESLEPVMMETICNKYVFFYSIALFTYVGSELSVGVWLNNYLFRVQNVSEQNASYITSSYWLFMTLGRFFMGFFTGRYYKDKEIHAQVAYCFFVSLGCLGFWIFESSVKLQVICICISGWFVGPLFGTTIIIALKTLPKRFSLNGISLIAGFGGTGAAIIPSIMGYVSENFGSQNNDGTSDGAGLIYFPDVVFISFTVAAFLWLGFYLLNKHTFDSKIRLK